MVSSDVVCVVRLLDSSAYCCVEVLDRSRAPRPTCRRAIPARDGRWSDVWEAGSAGQARLLSGGDLISQITREMHAVTYSTVQYTVDDPCGPIPPPKHPACITDITPSHNLGI